MWALRRKILFSVILFVLFCTPFILYFSSPYYNKPSCVDGVQNGEEAGVDCGGSCSLICSSDIIPIETISAHYFKNSDGTYDIGVLFVNKNSNSAPQTMKVLVIVSSVKDVVLFQKEYTVMVPLSSDFPLVIQRVVFADVPSKIAITKEESNSYALHKKIISPVVAVASFDKVSGKAVSVSMKNGTKTPLKRFPLSVVLYDDEKKPIGVSETFIDSLAANESKTVEINLGDVYAHEPASIRAYASLDPYAF